LPNQDHFAGRIIVYVGLDLIGDALIKLPFVRALRSAFPQHEIIWVAGDGQSAFAHELAQMTHGLIDQVFENTGTGQALAKKLRGQSVNLLIDTQSRVSTTRALRRLKPDVFISRAAYFLFSDVRPPLTNRRPKRLIDRLLQLVTLAAGAPVIADAPIMLSPQARRDAAELLPAGPKYVAIVPGAGGQHKIWPLEKHIAIANDLAARGYQPVVILGPAETDIFAAVKEYLPNAQFPLQDAQATGLALSCELTIALAERCVAGLAADCGGGHLLAAAGLPLVSLFGPTNAEKLAPKTTKSRILRAQSWNSSEMQAIPTVAVQNALMSIL
jgi:ADP-heptose:LPS heptosyltransferase